MRSFSLRSLNARQELLGVLAMLAVFVFTAVLFNYEQLPWGDEVLTVEPSFNQALGYGFTSYVYDTQTSDTFYAGNVPLFPYLMSIWLRVAGVSLATAHILNYLLTAAAVFLLWFGVRRGGVVLGPRWRLLLTFCLLSSAAVAYAAFNLRYDAWAIFLFACAFNACVFPGKLAKVGQFAFGFLMPLSAVHLLPVAALLSVVLSFYRLISWTKLWRVFVGGLLGEASLICLFVHEGVWSNFIAIGKQEGGQSLAEKLARFGYYFELDLTLKVLLVGLLLLVVSAATNRAFTKDRRVMAAFWIAVAFPVVLFVMRRYTRSYSWTATIPALFLVFAHFSRTVRPFPVLQRAALLVVVLSCTLGTPSVLIADILERHHRNNAVMDGWVAEMIPAQAQVLSTNSPFFAAKRRTRFVYLEQYFRYLPMEQRNTVQYLLIDAGSLDEVKQTMRGTWRKIGYIENPPVPHWVAKKAGRTYDIEAYQRVADAPANKIGLP
jgi:hypothetical protein